MTSRTLIIAPMTMADVGDVSELEQRAFPTPWSANTYRAELRNNQRSHYWVVRPSAGVSTGLPPILAYGGYWLLGDEIHIVTLAAHPNWRRRRLGEWLLLFMLETGCHQGATAVTLEVRRSNTSAIRLYEKTGFVQVGVRKHYYPRTATVEAEDALLLTLSGLQLTAECVTWMRRRVAIGEEVMAALSG